MIQHKFPLEIASTGLSPWLSPDDVTSVAPLPGWHNSIFRVDLVTGDRYVLKVHVPDEDSDFVEPTLRIADAYASVLPFVPGPVRTRDGALKATIERRVATLWPFVEGQNGETKAVTNEVAAKCLAAIHTAGLEVGRQLSDLDSETWVEKSWRANSRWNLETNGAFLYANRERYELWRDHLVDELRVSCDELAVELRKVDIDHMTAVPIHGDFYPNNLMSSASGQMVGVIDWDESRIDWRTWDLANGLLEFCAGPAGTQLDVTSAREFIGYYEAAGSALTETERATLPLLLRARKLDELMYSIAETESGAVEDWEYLNQSLEGWLEVRNLERL